MPCKEISKEKEAGCYFWVKNHYSMDTLEI